MSLTSQTITRTLASALALTLAGCASAPADNPQLSRLENELRAAYGDKYIAEYGHADLARAETALSAAREAIHNRHTDATQHDLTMAEGFINLGEVHGRQERTKTEIAALKVRQDQVRLAARDRELTRARNDAELSRSDAAQSALAAQQANEQAAASRADAAAALAANQATLDANQKAEQKMAAMRDQLRVYDLRMTELGATLVLRDVMFATNSAQLREGASNRLNPLINYLRSSPTTSVRIEGHTDSTGTSARNEVLSLDRANAVARALGDGRVSNPVSTFGFGQSKPIASNATVSGREQNRRVEITLLQ